MGNEEIIDSVVDPIAIKQFNDLKAASAAATEQMVIATKAAIALNNATGGSQSFSVFKKNAEAANVAVNTIIVNSQKVQQAEDKARVYKADMDEKAMNKYLVLLSRQEAARNAQDAKEVAAAQAKADKLAQIQAEVDANAAKRASAIGPTIIGGEPPNIATDKSGPAFSDETLAAQNEKVAAIAASQNVQTAATEKTTVAIQEESIALTEQQQVLNSVAGTFEQNISLQLTLQSELAAVRAEMKLVNTESVAGSAAKERLTGEELRLKAAIQANSTVLNQQAKEQISTGGSAVQLNARLAQLRFALDSLSVAERENINIGGVLKAEIDLLDASTKKLSADQGIHNKEVGNYAIGQTKVAAAIERVTSLQNIGARVITQFSRQIIGLATGFLSLEIGAKAIQSLIEYIKTLDLFNPIASSAEKRQKGLVDAFNSSDFSKAIENVESLQANLDLAKNGFADSDTVINQYNATIGKTAGFVDNLNDAQKGFIDHSQDFIKAAYLEAAAQSVLADSAKFAAETAAKNQKLRNEIEDNNSGKFTLGILLKTNLKSDDVDDNVVKKDQREIENNNRRVEENYQNSLKAIEGFYKDRNAILAKNGTIGAGNAGSDAIAQLRNQVANAELEQRKIIAQNIINDDRKSYSDRLKATQDYYNASKGIADNNEKLATDGIKLSALQKKKIEEDYSNNLLQIETTRANQIQTLNDKAFKQDAQHRKNQLEVAKGSAKEIVDNPDQSLNARLTALEIYKTKASAINKLTYDEQRRDAGQNAKSLTLAHDNLNSATLTLDKEYNDERLKIYKDVNEKLKQNLADLYRANKDEEIHAIELLDDANKAVLQKLDDQKNARAAKVAEDYEKRKISLKKYNKDILTIEDQYNIDRLNQEILHDQAVINIKKAKTTSDISFARGNGASDQQINDIQTAGDKDVQPDKDKLADDIKKRNDALNTQSQHQSKITNNQAEFNAFAQEAAKALDLAQQAEDAHYQHQIDLLEQKKQLIQETATVEIDAVNSSIQSAADKQRKINVINADAARQQKQLDDQEKKIKRDQAKFDKAASIAKIIEGTAVAIVNALAIPIYGEALAIAIGAIGAAELAIVASQPIPAYEKGTNYHKGGAFIWGEKGKELAIEPSGKSYFSPDGPTIGIAPPGTQIIPNHMIRPEKLNYAGAQQVPWPEILRQLRKNQPERQKRPVNKINVNLDSYYQKFYR